MSLELRVVEAHFMSMSRSSFFSMGIAIWRIFSSATFDARR
jgi:hypothetical protein